MVDILQEPGLIEYIGEKVVILGHHNADPDAIGAAQGIRELVERLKPDVFVEVVMPDDISRLSMNIIDGLGLDIVENTQAQFDTIVIVDSGGLNQLGAWRETINSHNGVKILIDHHTLEDEISKKLDLLLHDESVSSTCELVFRLFEDYHLTPTDKTSKALLVGIIFDTKYLSLGDSQTFQTVSKLLQNLGDISEVRAMLYQENDVSERIARLKTAQRTELHRIGDWVVAFSEVGSFQASGARALISLGADLAIVVGEEKDELRASLRSTQRFFDKSGVHLGELVSGYAEIFGGSGSGHPTAAGYNGSGVFGDFKKGVLRMISKRID